jgi:hypothetical protein
MKTKEERQAIGWKGTLINRTRANLQREACETNISGSDCKNSDEEGAAG